MLRKQQQHCEKCEWIVFIALGLVVAVSANSSSTTLDKPSLDGLQITTVPTTTSEGFKPSSYDLIRTFSSADLYKQAAEFQDRNYNVRKPEHFKLDILRTESPTIIKLFNGTESSSVSDNVNSSSVEFSKTESLAPPSFFPGKRPRLYYGDIPRKGGQGLGYPSKSQYLNEISVSDPRPSHFEGAGYKFYYPDKYSTGPKSNSRETIAHASDYSHSHGQDSSSGHHAHGPGGDHDHHNHEHHSQDHGGHRPQGQEGHGHSHGTGYAPVKEEYRGVISGHEHEHAHYSYPPPHYGHNGQSHADFGGFIGGPALGKALSLLLPSALLLTGVSALFPKRVLVPTQPIKDTQRQKRSVPQQQFGHSEFDDSFEVIPSTFLRREHRIDGGEEKMYDYDDGTLQNNPYVTQSVVPSHLQISDSSHRTSHVPPLIVNQVPYFVRIPQEQLSYLNPIGLATHQQPSQFPFTGQAEFNPYQIQNFPQNPLNPGFATLPPQVTNPIPTQFPRPTAATKQLTAATPSSIPGSSLPKAKAVIKRLNKSRPGNQNSVNIASNDAESESIKVASSRQIESQRIAKENEKDLTNGKGVAKALQEFLQTTERSASASPEFDLSPSGPVVGLLTAAVEHQGQSDPCQRRALCELALRGNKPTATKFETFLWSIATLMPEAFTAIYDVDDVFAAIRNKNCVAFKCANPDLNIQE